MLEVKNLTIKAGTQTLLQNISFSLSPGKCLGLTGASGSGKTTIIKAIMGILPKSCALTAGSIFLDGVELNKLSGKKRRSFCGSVMGFIPQSPMTAFDPYQQIGTQMIETFHICLKLPKEKARILSLEQLEKMNLKDGNRIMNTYPGQLSGGMLQRIAMACLAGMSPQYILADEPTSALDEENRNHLLKLLQGQLHSAGILFITHDLAALSSLCTETMILDKKTIIEQQNTKDIFYHPQQAWTKQFVSTLHMREGGGWDWKDLK